VIRGTILIFAGDSGATPRELRYKEWWQRSTNGEWRVRWGMDGPVQEYTPEA